MSAPSTTTSRTSAPTLPPGKVPVTTPLPPVRKRLHAILDTRAEDEAVLQSAERRFFVRYDAWTFPQIRALLDDPAQAMLLSDAARAMFVDDKPELPVHTGTLWLLAHVLGRQVLDRVEKQLVLGQQPGAPALLDEERQILAKWGLTVDDALLALAEYHERIFDAAFPGSEERPSDALLACFACFSAGMLHFLPPTDATAPGPNERTLGDPLNAEPDGWLFFAFAEFAWQAARVRTGRSAYWLALAQHFAAMQEVYTWTYGPSIGPRNPGSYARWRRRACAPIPMRDMLALSARYRARYGTPDPLAKRLAYNALRSFRDGR